MVILSPSDKTAVTAGYIFFLTISVIVFMIMNITVSAIMIVFMIVTTVGGFDAKLAIRQNFPFQ